VADVVLGFDGSPSARAALRVAVEQAKQFEDRLVIVFADGPPGRTVGEGLRDHRLVLEELGRGLIEEAGDKARESGVEVETLLLDQRPAAALEGFSRARATRLIVVGTHGEGPLASAILGSTPHKLLHASEVPVLCVPAPPEKAG